MSYDANVIVIGGGPAGSSAAIALASAGHTVLLVDRERFPRHKIGESLPPKVTPLLLALGVLEQIDAAGFVRMQGTTVCLGDDIVTHDFDPTGRQLGYQVERARFDTILLEHAKSRGVKVIERCVANDAISGIDGGVMGVRARSEEGKELELFAPWTIDASGSSAVLSRALGFRRKEEIRTLALAGYWRGCRAPSTFPVENTLFEMLPVGWIWSIVRADGLRNVTLGVDTGALKQRAAAPRVLYDQLIRTSRLVGPLLEGATLEGEIMAHDATWASADRFIGRGFIAAGDAASFIDPLTSQGVYKALHSGLAAAAVIQTIVTRPDDRALAETYYQQTQATLFESYAEVALSFYRASPHADSKFWASRVQERHGSGPGPELRAGRRGQFLEAVRTRGGKEIRLQRRPALSVAPRPALDGGLIVARATLVAGPLGAISLPATQPVLNALLLAKLLDGRTLEEVFEAYSESTGTERSAELGKALLTTITVLAELDLVSWS